MVAVSALHRISHNALRLNVLLALCMTPSVAAAQRNSVCTPRHPMIADVRFAGNNRKSMADPVLMLSIKTEKSGWARVHFGWNIGTLACLDSVEVKNDENRLLTLYQARGYPAAKIGSRITKKGSKQSVVQFLITEGTPIRIAAVTFESLPPKTADSKRLRDQLMGAVLDSVALSDILDSVRVLIQDAGYAHARRADTTITRDTAARTATLEIKFRPGDIFYVGHVAVAVTTKYKKPALDSNDVRSILQFKTGDRFSPRSIGASQRAFYETQLYAGIRMDTVAKLRVLETDSSRRDTLHVNVQLTEGLHELFRLGVGWGSADCFRTQFRYVDQSFFGSAEKLEFTARLSKIGLAAPLDLAKDLCAPRVRTDPYSTHLNYYLGTTLNVRGVLGARLKPTFTLYSERRAQLFAYEQITDLGAVATVSRDISPMLQVNAQYRFVKGRTIADRAVACFPFGFCRIEDLPTFLFPSPIHSIDVGAIWNPLLPSSDPSSGWRWQADVKVGHTDIAQITPVNFLRLTGEAAIYRPVGKKFVLALRGQMGYVVASGNRSSLLPPQERFYSGGQNTVRGFDENALGPGSYIVSKVRQDTLGDGTVVGVARATDAFSRIAPSGGNAMWVANLELRTRGEPGSLLRYVLFLDAGKVWNTTDVFTVLNAGTRITPGVGVRLLTPIGPFRVDIGYNPYPYEAGPAFFIDNGNISKGILGRAICVSPGTTEPFVLPTGAPSPSVSCPASYTPLRQTGLLPRLKFQFSIGNAF